MDEPQPEVRWAPLPPAPQRTGRVWLIVGLSVAALGVVALVLFFAVFRGGMPGPEGFGTPPVGSSETPPDGATPMTSAPPVDDPTLEVFRDKVSGWLSAVEPGLDIVTGASTEDAIPVVDSLIDDAQRLGDALPPSSIQDSWRSGVETYAQQLTALRSAVEDGSGVSAAIDSARAAAADLRDLVDL